MYCITAGNIETNLQNYNRKHEDNFKTVQQKTQKQISKVKAGNTKKVYNKNRKQKTNTLRNRKYKDKFTTLQQCLYVFTVIKW